MKRPWQVWLWFVLCVGAAAGGMAWLTRQARQVDLQRQTAEADAALEQRVNLTLWRMDTELAPIIAEELIRPVDAYQATGSPAPLPPYVLLHFEVQTDGIWSSPQQATMDVAELPKLAELTAAVEFPRFIARLPDIPLPSGPHSERHRIAADTAGTQDTDQQRDTSFPFLLGNATNVPSSSDEEHSDDVGPKVSKAADLEQRNLRYQSMAQQNYLSRELQNQELQMAGPRSEIPVYVGASRPLWVGDRLLLARQVRRNEKTLVQGAWLDWPRLKVRLLREANDALLDADLVALHDDAHSDPGRMLAGLPVRLVVREPLTIAAVSPALQWALWMGWGATLLAVAAAAALLHGVMALSERRAAFVSSVTHELRTPLTTFRMYAEMLARGMVPDANRRQEYFQTLHRESERLSLLVENVLAYARLERGRKPKALHRTTLAELLNRVGPRLSDRASQAGMKCVVSLNRLPIVHREGEPRDTLQASPSLAENSHAFTTDVSVVEQILFNLVDNAAKYANGAKDRRIHVDGSRNGSYVNLSVCDHGPGMTARRWPFHARPFGKTAEESAESAPGVGLGLPLCRRLARQIGGRLQCEPAPGGGTLVRLVLPGK